MTRRLVGFLRTIGTAAVAVALGFGGASTATGVESNIPFRPGLLPALHNGARIPLGGVEASGLREPAALSPSLVREARDTLGSAVVSYELSTLSGPLALDPSVPYVVGVTWEGETAILTEARYYRDGAWEEWEAIESDDRGGDRPGSEDLFGTEPYILSGVDAFQVRSFTADGTPKPLEVLVYSSEVTAEDAALAEGRIGTASSVAASRLVDVPQPPIRGRAEWGARTPTDWFEETYIEGAAVHHTAGVNDYARAEVPGILRSIQNLHMNGREFWDIGYNFLIDKYGVIWEGRAGGVENSARGAHSHTFNPLVTGVSIMGNFQQVRVPGAAIDSLVALLAWKLTLHGASADGLLLHEGVWPAIIGHKDIPESSTSCPGIWLYQLLPEIRARVTAAQQLPEAPYSADVTGDGIADLVSVFGDSVVVHGSGFALDPTTPAPPVLDNAVFGVDVGLVRDPESPFIGSDVVATFDATYDLVTAGPSLTRDGGTDVIARERFGGRVVRFADSGNGTLGDPVEVTTARYADIIVSPGDVTGDGRADLILADAERGLVSIETGDGTGRVSNATPALPSLGRLTALAAAGDINVDGIPDLVIVVEDGGRLAVALGDGTGGFADPITVGDGWDGFDEFAAMGDVNGDGFGDLVARRSGDAVTRTVVGTATGLSGEYVEWSLPTVAWRDPMTATSWAGEPGIALLALAANGDTLVRALVPEPPPTGEPPGSIRFTQEGVRSAFVVGDIDGNGLADVATVQEDGSLLLHLSTEDGFAVPLIVSDPGDNSTYDMLGNRPLEVPLPPVPEEDPPFPTDLPVVPPPWGESRIRSHGEIPDGGPFWSEYTSVAGAGDIDFDGTPDLVAVTQRGDVLVFTWDPTDPSRVERGLPVALGMIGYRVLGVGPWRPGSISDLLAVSPAGEVALISGRGMTGGHVGTAIDGGWRPDDEFHAIGQVGPGVRPTVVVIDPNEQTAGAYSWTASGDWTLVASLSD